MLAAAIVDGRFGPAKIDYEIHGNTSRIFIFIFPRGRDPYEGGPRSTSNGFQRRRTISTACEGTRSSPPGDGLTACPSIGNLPERVSCASPGGS